MTGRHTDCRRAVRGTDPYLAIFSPYARTRVPIPGSARLNDYHPSPRRNLGERRKTVRAKDRNGWCESGSYAVGIPGQDRVRPRCGTLYATTNATMTSAMPP